MTKNLQIKWKIIIPIALISIMGSLATYYFTSEMYKESEIRSYLNKARTISIAAEGARDFSNNQNKHNVFKDSIADVDDFLKTVPIVAAMELAKSKAKELNFEFKVPAEQFRNPDNTPDAFENKMLSRLRAQSDTDNANIDTWELHVEDGVEKLVYFRGVYLTEDCMKCHGNPSLSSVYWDNNKGLDPTGAKMEDMEVGYMKGAFEISMDMQPVYDRVSEASSKILVISVTVGILIILIALWVASTISKPVKQLQDVATKISDGDLSQEIIIDRGDEVGKLAETFEKVRLKLLNVIVEANEFSSKIVSGQLSSKIDTSKATGAYKELYEGYNSVMSSSTSIIDKTSNVMVGNANGIITYMNSNLIEMFNSNLSEIQKAIPDFDVAKLVGINIDKFHRNPAHNRSILEGLTGTHSAPIRLGKLTFKLKITPIFHNGEKTAFVVVWDDYSADAIFQNELNNIISYVNNGELQHRIEVPILGEEFKQTGESINEMLESVVKPFNVASNYINNISKGIIPNEIVDEYKGEYKVVTDNLNNLILSLNMFIDEMQNMSAKHSEGFISVKINESNFEGAYNTMASGVNGMVFEHIETKKKAINIISEFGNGNFDADIEKLPNEKVFINHAIDSVRDNLKKFQAEVKLLIDAAKNGELETRGQAGQFSGEWSGLVEGLNNIMEEIAQPIAESGIILSKMSSGDFRDRMSGDYLGQFGELKDNINTLADSLSSLLSSLQDSINTTAATAAELSATSESMASASAEQSAQADEVASAVEEMSHTITDNARSSSQTSEVATNNGDSAREGGRIVKETISKMKDIATVVSDSAITVGELGNSSKEIGEIVSVIDDIAEQTNMLALNAAIEAARAGEQGRGFAVVADEVRKLAERTSEATKRISTMIGSIQIKTGEAVEAMNRGNKEVDLGIKLADEAGMSLNSILDNAKQVLDMINQIAAASEEQSATSEEISKNVVGISQVTSEFSRKVQDVSLSAEELSKLTNDLENTISKFKFDTTSSSSNQSIEGSNSRLLN